MLPGDYIIWSFLEVKFDEVTIVCKDRKEFCDCSANHKTMRLIYQMRESSANMAVAHESIELWSESK